MLSYAIKREALALPPILAGTKASRHVTKRQRIFDEAWLSFWGDIGDVVVFKNSRAPSLEWTVAEVECDYTKCRWSKKSTPNFIKLQRTVPLSNGQTRTDTVWTHPKQIKKAPA